ncbi:hypothetical protein FI667_g9307, partial [Globisporangium splendens]
MFNRFFKNKDDGASKAGPPGHRSSQPGQGGGPNGGGDDLTGGGFFNLPPPVAKPYGAPSPAKAIGGGQPIVVPSSGAPSGPSTYTRPGQLPGYQQPSYGNSNYDASSANGSSSATSAGGAVDMFGGMSLKNPPMAAGNAGGYPSAHQQQNYGGASSAHPPYGGGVAIPQSAAPAPQPTGGSLFSGLDLASGSGLSTSHEEHPGGMMERRKSATRTVGSFNYLNVAASSAATESSSNSMQYQSRSASMSSTAPRQATKVVKKKKKTFRPGFGRQLSDESIAALQRGDLKEEDIMAGTGDNGSSETSGSSSRPATNPTDLAHLLPPVGAGSVLSGLTVHKSAVSTTTGGTGGGSVLAGLTVHSSAASPQNPPASPKAEPGNGVLAGLTVRTKSSSSLTRASSKSDVSTSAVVEEPAPSPAAEEKAPPAPAAPPTPEERLLNTLRDFHASAVSFRENVLKQNEEENRILERKIQLANQLTQYEIDLRDVEAQQHHACEVEDFERADALNATINSVRHCITLTESDVRKVDSELAAFVKSKEKAFANQLRSTRGTLRELEKFRDDQEAERVNLRNEFKEYEVKETEQLQFEAERIDTEMHHVSVNLEHLAAEKSEIESTIEEQCKDEFVVQAQLLEEKAAVEEEVRELERKLKLKLERVREIQESINKAEKEIDLVRNRYSRQLKRIADRESGILKTKQEVESDVEQLKHQKKEFHEKINEYETNISTFGKRILVVRKEMRAAALLASVLEVQETRREQSIVRKKQQTAELTSLSDAAAIAEQSFVMLRKQHDELEKSLSIHRNAIASAESMIPRLEQEKKTAAAQRNFKDAARISKDIKALEKDRSTAEEMVEVVEMELQDLKERIDKREVEYEEKKDELKKVEKQLELTTLQELWKEAKHLRVAIRKMEKFKSEGAAADDGIDFRSSAILLVQAEYEACMIQVEVLESKYDVTDPNQDQEDDIDDDDDEVDEIIDDDVDVVRESVGITHIGNSYGAAEAGDGGEVDLETIGDGTMALEDIASKLSELETMIEKATENEEYELAARLDEKIEVLKRRQHSIIALASRDAPTDVSQENEDDKDGDDDDDDEEHYQEAEEYDASHTLHESHDEPTSTTHAGQSYEKLTQELDALRERIVQVEDEIDYATEHEEYETAATFDEELQSLRGEEEEIQRLLQACKPTETGVSDRSTTSSQEEKQGGGSSLFSGLGVKQPSVEKDINASTASSSIFGGLEVNSPQNVPADTTDPVATEGSLFGGLQLSDGVTPPEKLSRPPSPIEDAVVTEEEATAGNSPSGLAIDSPTSYSNTEDSFFGGLQVGGTTHTSLPEASTSMFGGLEMNSTASQEDSGSVFSGLTLGQSVQTHATSEDHETVEDVQSKSVHLEETSNAMLTGLRVSITSATGSEVQSRTGSSSSLIEDEHSTDSPMTIHELSGHSLHSDEETTISVPGIISHESSFTDISFTSTSVSTTASTTTTTTTTTESLFGGLSLVGPSAVSSVSTTSEVHGTATGNDHETFDDAKQEL